MNGCSAVIMKPRTLSEIHDAGEDTRLADF